jgi:hypothetical protein
MTADKCGGKKPAKDTDTVKEESEVKTEEVKTEKKKPAKAEKKEDSEELAEGEEIVKVEEVKPVKDKEPEDLEETEETEEIETEETEEIEEPEEKPAKKGNQGARSDLIALKNAGLDSAPEPVKKAFIAGYRSNLYKGKEEQDKKAEKMAADSDDEVKEFYLKLFEAAQDVRPTLGDIKVGAYDSAEAIYQEACKKLNLKCTELSAQDVYNNFKQRKTQKPVVSGVPSERKISGRLESLLNQ